MNAVIQELEDYSLLAIDTETTGLDWNDQVFSIQISNGKNSYYINFNREHPHPFSKPYIVEAFKPLWDNKNITWVAHKALFDMIFLAKMGIKLQGRVVCTMGLPKWYQNNKRSYSLDALLSEYGKAKDDRVMAYIKEHKLHTMEQRPGKKTKGKKLHFDRVPFELISEYGMEDTNLTYFLYQKISKSEFHVEQNLSKLVCVCLDMHIKGILLNVRAILEAKDRLEIEIDQVKSEISDMAGRPYAGGRKFIEYICDKFHLRLPKKEESGNIITDKDTLSKQKHVIFQKIVQVRNLEKMKGTYLESFLYYHENGVIHPSPNPFGTATGRFSYSNPNFQNIPKDDPHKIRSFFLPFRNHTFLAIDYEQQEFRIFVDYLGHRKLIYDIMEGKDVHQATADLMKCDRKSAKALNFLLIYGGGVGLLAQKLGISQMEATRLRVRYFEAIKGAEKLIGDIQRKALRNGFITNWAGRRLYLPRGDKTYIMPNHLIQSSGADVMKQALIECHRYLEDKKSFISATIHDEILFQIENFELENTNIVNDLKNIMESVYSPVSGMKLTCSCSLGTNWGNLKEL
jgi:DNA polymerase-1